jgi:hypothetical protein
MGWEDKKIETSSYDWYDLDISKIETIEDVKKVLGAIDFHINEHHPHINQLKPYLKVRPRYGRQRK